MHKNWQLSDSCIIVYLEVALSIDFEIGLLD
jgi:hypothetical protein